MYRESRLYLHPRITLGVHGKSYEEETRPPRLGSGINMYG